MNHVFPAVICSPVLRSLWASAPLKALQTHFGFTPKTVVRCVRDQIARHGRADAPPVSAPDPVTAGRHRGRRRGRRRTESPKAWPFGRQGPPAAADWGEPLTAWSGGTGRCALACPVGVASAPRLRSGLPWTPVLGRCRQGR